MKQNLVQRIKPLAGTAPTAHSGTTAVNSAIIDRQGFDSAVILVSAAQTTSNPTVATITPKIVHGNASNLSDVGDVTLNTAITAIECDAAAAFVAYQVDLRGMKRYIRVVTTPAFTGGTSPEIAASVGFVLSDANIEPQPSAVTVYAKA